MYGHVNKVSVLVVDEEIQFFSLGEVMSLLYCMGQGNRMFHKVLSLEVFVSKRNALTQNSQ